MGIRYILAALLVLASAPAFASGQCYSPEEMHAEQLLRLHSELMVITVTCHTSSVGEDLVPKYTGFTQHHLKILHDAEHKMMHYYATNDGHGDGVEKLDKLRTKLANEYGQKIADQSAPAFCAESRDKVVTMYHAEPEQVDLEVQRMMVDERSYAQQCSGSSAHVANHR